MSWHCLQEVAEASWEGSSLAGTPSLPARFRNIAAASSSHASATVLNPEWVEWLMGWPLGWTSVLQPLATDRFREWQQQHGGF